MRTVMKFCGVLLSVFILGGIAAQAEMPSLPKKQLFGVNAQKALKAQAESTGKDPRRDPNVYCLNCHGKLTTFKHGGKHFQSSTLSPNNKQPVNCVSCHGNISENHRKGVKDVMRFSTIKGTKNPALERSVSEQNQVCLACHQPKKLREAFWGHDVHAMKLSCSTCHQLHPSSEPMKNSSSKRRAKMCVDCHTKLQAGVYDARLGKVPNDKVHSAKP